MTAEILALVETRVRRCNGSVNDGIGLCPARTGPMRCGRESGGPDIREKLRDPAWGCPIGRFGPVRDRPATRWHAAGAAVAGWLIYLTWVGRIPRRFIRQRRDTCAACEHRVWWHGLGWVCGLCGCLLRIATVVGFKTCPDEPPRWPAMRLKWVRARRRRGGGCCGKGPTSGESG